MIVVKVDIFEGNCLKMGGLGAMYFGLADNI